MATPKKKAVAKKSTPKKQTIPKFKKGRGKQQLLDGSVATVGKKVPTPSMVIVPQVPVEDHAATESINSLRASQEVVDQGFKEIALETLVDDVLDQMKNTAFSVKRTAVAVNCMECDEEIEVVALYYPAENKISYTCPKCKATEVEEHNWFNQKLNGELVNPWTDEIVTLDNYDSQFSSLEELPSEVICKVCGFPDWWVDNDCTACGGMSYEEATKDIQLGKD